MSEIKEKVPERYPQFKEACKNFTIEEIFTMAEATYKLQVARAGGVIDETQS